MANPRNQDFFGPVAMLFGGVGLLVIVGSGGLHPMPTILWTMGAIFGWGAATVLRD